MINPLPSIANTHRWLKRWQKSSHLTNFVIKISKYNKIIPTGDNSSYMLPWLPTIFLGPYNNGRRWWAIPYRCEGQDPYHIIGPNVQFTQHQHPGIFADLDSRSILVSQVAVIFTEIDSITFYFPIMFFNWRWFPCDLDTIFTDRLPGNSLGCSTRNFLRKIWVKQ